MISAILVGLGLIFAVVGSFASEIYLAKTVDKKCNVLNQNHYNNGLKAPDRRLS